MVADLGNYNYCFLETPKDKEKPFQKQIYYSILLVHVSRRQALKAGMQF